MGVVVVSDDRGGWVGRGLLEGLGDSCVCVVQRCERRSGNETRCWRRRLVLLWPALRSMPVRTGADVERGLVVCGSAS